MSSIEELEKRLEAVEARNRKVSADKGWETSAARRICIMVITYVLIGIYMNILGVHAPWENAVIPTTGFLLSTLTLSWVKQVWLARQK
jgi:hypothetical protein